MAPAKNGTFLKSGQPWLFLLESIKVFLIYLGKQFDVATILVLEISHDGLKELKSQGVWFAALELTNVQTRQTGSLSAKRD